MNIKEEDLIIKHIRSRLDVLKVQDNGYKQLEMVNCLVNLLWEAENNYNSSATFSREWSLGRVRIRIEHVDI